MSSVTTAKEPAGRWQFRLSSLLWLQLIVAPVFLSPFYLASRGPQATIALLATLAALVCYVSVLVAWGMRAVRKRRFPVIAGGFRGALYGSLFFLIAWGPVIAAYLVNERRVLETLSLQGWQADPAETVRIAVDIVVETASELLGFIGIFLAAGASIGSVVTLVMTAFFRREVVSPEP